MNFSPAHVRVLCLGHDERLLETRVQVLASRYETVSVRSLAEMRSLPGDARFDIVLLCHTLSPEECGVCSEVARERWPEARVLAIAVERGSCWEYADQVVKAMDGPRVLFGAIDQMLAPMR